MSNIKNDSIPKLPPPGRLPGEFNDEERRLINERRLKAGYKADEAIKRPLAGIALSGGGIRSATFCLGLFQSLAKQGLLRQVDYLSTVSGGGYFGSFLGRMFTRNWVTDPPQGGAMRDAAAALAGPDHPPAHPPNPAPVAPVADVPAGNPRQHRSLRGRQFLENLEEEKFVPAASGLQPEKLREVFPHHHPDAISRVEAALADSQSPPLVWLRESSNYLAPGGASDGALDISIYLRNWLSMLVVMLTLAFPVFLFVNGLRFSLDIWLGQQEWWRIETLLAQAAGAHLWWTPAMAVPVVIVAICVVPLGMAYWLTQMKWETWGVLGAYAVLIGAGVVHMFFFAARPISVLGFMAGLSLFAIAWRALFEIAARWHRVSDSRMWIRNQMAKWLRGVVLMAAASFVFALVDGWGQSIYAVVSYTGNWHEAAPAITGILGLTALAPVLRSIILKGPEGAGKFKVPLQHIALAFSAVLVLVLMTGISLASHAVAWEGRLPVFTEVPGPVNPSNNLPAVINPGEQIYNHWNKETNSVQLTADHLIQIVPVESQLKPHPPALSPETVGDLGCIWHQHCGHALVRPHHWIS